MSGKKLETSSVLSINPMFLQSEVEDLTLLKPMKFKIVFSWQASECIGTSKPVFLAWETFPFHG